MGSHLWMLCASQPTSRSNRQPAITMSRNMLRAGQSGYSFRWRIGSPKCNRTCLPAGNAPGNIGRGQQELRARFLAGQPTHCPRAISQRDRDWSDKDSTLRASTHCPRAMQPQSRIGKGKAICNARSRPIARGQYLLTGETQNSGREQDPRPDPLPAGNARQFAGEAQGNGSLTILSGPFRWAIGAGCTDRSAAYGLVAQI